MKEEDKMCYGYSELSSSFLRDLVIVLLLINKIGNCHRINYSDWPKDGISVRGLFTVSLEKNSDPNQAKFDLHDLCNSHKLHFV
jgi:hypothetical protein